MSDHFSGPRALAGPQCDISDFYAFPSPEQPGNLILVMDVLPFATASSSFSDAIICRLRVRPASIAFWDQVDGVTHWPLSAEGAHPPTELLLADFLVVDTSKGFSENSNFEIERAILEGRAHETCGGRSLNEDVMDVLYTLYVNGGKGPRIRDGVDQATAPASQTLPYLAPPNLKPAQPKSAFLASQDAAKAKPSDHQQGVSDHQHGPSDQQHGPGDHHHYKFGRFQV